MPDQRLPNRQVAGQRLADKLQSYKNCPDGLVLALPRGGVPVAFIIAQSLQLPLDLCLVRKLGTPGQKELAMGAIALGGIQVMNQELIKEWQISPQQIQKVVQAEKQELERRNQRYRGGKPYPNLADRTLILVDDGIATGATMQAAIAALRPQKPQAIIVSIPVAAPSVVARLQKLVEKVVCLIQVDPLYSLSVWYEDFTQTSDQEVQDYLAQANSLFSA